MPYYMDLPGITWAYVSLVQLEHEKDASTRGRTRLRTRLRECQSTWCKGAPVCWALVAQLGLLVQCSGEGLAACCQHCLLLHEGSHQAKIAIVPIVCHAKQH